MISTNNSINFNTARLDSNNMMNHHSLELLRTSSAHMGPVPLKERLETVNSWDLSKPSDKPRISSPFADMLGQAIEDLNSKQMDVSKINEKIVTDPESLDIHDVTVAMAKAKQSLELAQTVIDRLVSGWENLSQNR